MPSWLINALVIVLILWTLLEIFGWAHLVYILKTNPRFKFELRTGAFASTIAAVFSWIVLICYWLR